MQIYYLLHRLRNARSFINFNHLSDQIFRPFYRYNNVNVNSINEINSCFSHLNETYKTLYLYGARTSVRALR